eukprot:14532719-Alexandrium_andersonii.AAC.1
MQRAVLGEFQRAMVTSREPRKTQQWAERRSWPRVCQAPPFKGRRMYGGGLLAGYLMSPCLLYTSDAADDM